MFSLRAVRWEGRILTWPSSPENCRSPRGSSLVVGFAVTATLQGVIVENLPIVHVTNGIVPAIQ